MNANNDIGIPGRKKFPALLLLVVLLLALSALSGYLLSRASFVGRAGIHLFYREYSFLKTWWQGAALVFSVWMLLAGLQAFINRRLPGTRSLVVQVLFGVLGAIGLYLTFCDFTNVRNHRLLGERFHLGGYLFWIGWIVISVFFAVRSQRPPG